MYPHTICIDLDGTLLTDEWPALGTWRHGALDALRRLHEEGLHVVVYSCRFNQRTPYGEPRPVSELFNEYQTVREMFDSQGLGFVEIAMPWQGKPPATIYIDDRAVNFNIDNPNEWKEKADSIIFFNRIYGGAKYPPISYDRDGGQMTLFEVGQ